MIFVGICKRDLETGCVRLTADDINTEGMLHLLHNLVMMARKDLMDAYFDLQRAKKHREAVIFSQSRRPPKTPTAELRAKRVLDDADHSVKDCEYKFEQSKKFFRTPLFDAMSKETTGDEYIEGLINGLYETSEEVLT